jgi:hypothetical protein
MFTLDGPENWDIGVEQMLEQQPQVSIFNKVA